MRTFIAVFVVFLLAGGVTHLAAQEQSQETLKVSKIAVCTGIDRENRAPEGEATSFPDTTSKVYCFTHVEGASGEIEITHKWFYGDKLMAEVTLPVRSNSWRTWSSKNLVKSWKGGWHVEVAGPDGEVLATREFTVEKTGE